jgi:hypothetical protein
LKGWLAFFCKAALANFSLSLSFSLSSWHNILCAQSFPGDCGLINAESFWPTLSELKLGFDRTVQDNFHLFVQCSNNPWEDHYQGKGARGKYLYMGKYRRVPGDPDADIEETARTFQFSQLSEESKKAMATYFNKCQRTAEWREGGNFKSAGPEDVCQYLDDDATTTEEVVKAWIAMLEDKNYRIEIVPVEFVKYDEDLYRALVTIGADNGQVSTRFEDIGPV